MGMAANPNVYGVVAIGLGCEMNRMDGFIKELRARTDKPIEGLLIQEEGGTIETVAKAKKNRPAHGHRGLHVPARRVRYLRAHAGH